MRCQQVKGLLPAHFDKELSEGNHRALEEHLAGCASCHARWRGLHRAETWLTHAPQQSTVKRGPSVDFTASVFLKIAARQQEAGASSASSPAGPEATPLAHSQSAVRQPPLATPLGPWSGWDASALGMWKPSSRLVLSGALVALLSVMVVVIALGVLLTQPTLVTQIFGGVAAFFAGIASLADNQLLLAGVAVGYVGLACLWFYLMRHQDVEARHSWLEEVES